MGLELDLGEISSKIQYRGDSPRKALKTKYNMKS